MPTLEPPKSTTPKQSTTTKATITAELATPGPDKETTEATGPATKTTTDEKAAETTTLAEKEEKNQGNVGSNKQADQPTATLASK